MYMPSIFGESLFDNMFPFDEKFFTEKKDPLYGKNVSRLMKTDVRETDEIQIELKDGYLTVSAEKGLDKDEEDKKGKYIRKERYAGALSRTFYLGEEIREEEIKAKFENGILSVSIPKEEEKKVEGPKHISIEG